jgi:colanic acid/amylovoran biosynthesis protein
VRVHLLQNNFSCLEYDAFVKEFEFIICSRFHGIVHAYRNYVPVIALGWAVKYQELTRAVGQESYMFDITAEDCDREALLQAIRNMIKNREEERHTIQTNMEKIQQENCFECISEWVKEKDE